MKNIIKGGDIMLSMAIVGMGKMAAEHAKWIDENKDMKLTAICEKNVKRHTEIKEKYGVDVYSDIDSLLSSEKDLDFAVIVTTNEVHEELTIKALESGANVIVEKPMTLTYESTKRMVAAAEKNKKHLFVHQSSRWDREYLLLLLLLPHAWTQSLFSSHLNMAQDLHRTHLQAQIHIHQPVLFFQFLFYHHLLYNLSLPHPRKARPSPLLQ
ncbi:Inositol 2-dehydrogenase/D-chiro-inositol 3-dehydrogenase [subsurface metagenome]